MRNADPSPRAGRFEGAWAGAARLLADAHDVVLDRADLGEAPAWCVARGWEPCLRSLSDEAVAAAERAGAEALALLPGAPPSLVEFAREVARLARVDALPASDVGGAARGRRASDRKWAQVGAFAAACASLARASARIVDVGSGHGHLTRHLAAAFGRPALGLERDARRVAVATALADEAGGAGGAPDASFAAVDVLRDGIGLRRGDLAVGLHACGELGDLAIDAAAEAGASIALVSCCLQKTRAAARAPRDCPAGVDRSRLVWPREVLGLSNLAPRGEGVEALLEQNLAARRNRLALTWLLRERGLAFGPGEALAGLNRRRAHAPFAEFAAVALARRGLAPATDRELARAAASGAVSHARARRYALPRNALGRLVETFVLYDRARALEARGYAVAAGAIFPDDLSPRNLGLLAAPR